MRESRNKPTARPPQARRSVPPVYLDALVEAFRLLPATSGCKGYVAGQLAAGVRRLARVWPDSGRPAGSPRQGGIYRHDPSGAFAERIGLLAMLLTGEEQHDLEHELERMLLDGSGAELADDGPEGALA